MMASVAQARLCLLQGFDLLVQIVLMRKESVLILAQEYARSLLFVCETIDLAYAALDRCRAAEV